MLCEYAIHRFFRNSHKSELFLKNLWIAYSQSITPVTPWSTGILLATCLWPRGSLAAGVWASPGPIAFKAWFTSHLQTLCTHTLGFFWKHIGKWVTTEKKLKYLKSHWKQKADSQGSPTVKAFPQPWDTRADWRKHRQDLDSRLCGKMKRSFRLDGFFRGSLIQLPCLHEETETPGPTVSKLKSQE